MKVTYKGFEVDAHKEKSMGGDLLLYYSVFRVADGYEVTSGFSYGNDRVPTFVKFLKSTVDDFLEDPQAYYKSRGMELDASEFDEEEDEDTYDDRQNQEEDNGKELQS